jgi:sorbitol-specific phosphotransferase system component IIC
MATLKQLYSDKDWPGALRLALPALGVIFVSSVVTLGLGGIYGSKVSNKHRSELTAFVSPTNNLLPKYKPSSITVQNLLI